MRDFVRSISGEAYILLNKPGSTETLDFQASNTRGFQRTTGLLSSDDKKQAAQRY